MNRPRHPTNSVRSLSLAFSAVLLLGLLRVPALSNLVLDRLEVDLWPEYDRPGVLVIYRLHLPAGTALPEPLQVRIPAAAGEPSAVAAQQPDGSLLNLPYDREVSGSWSVVSFSAPTTVSQLEYYDPSLQIQGAEHRYAYLWPGDYEVKDLTIQVQQPAGATAMQITPPLGVGVLGSDGLLYFSRSLGPSPAGQEVALALVYEKSGSALSFERLQPMQPIAGPPSAWERMLNWPDWPWVMGGTGVALVVVGSVFFLRGRRQVRTDPGGRPLQSSEEGASTSHPARFCHNCGHPAGEADLYCRMCGTRLRKS